MNYDLTDLLVAFVLGTGAGFLVGTVSWFASGLYLARREAKRVAR